MHRFPRACCVVYLRISVYILKPVELIITKAAVVLYQTCESSKIYSYQSDYMRKYLYHIRQIGVFIFLERRAVRERTAGAGCARRVCEPSKHKQPSVGLEKVKQKHLCHSAITHICRCALRVDSAENSLDQTPTTRSSFMRWNVQDDAARRKFAMRRNVPIAQYTATRQHINASLSRRAPSRRCRGSNRVWPWLSSAGRRQALRATLVNGE